MPETGKPALLFGKGLACQPQVRSERLSLLAAYAKNKGIFRCPGDRQLWTVNGQSVMRPRSFGLNAYVAWVGDPWHDMPNAQKYRVLHKTTDAKNASLIFMFGEINPKKRSVGRCSA